MLRYQNTVQAIAKHLEEPHAIQALGIFRIVVGILTFVQFALVSPQIQELYGKFGFLEANLMKAISGWTLPMTASWFERHGIMYSWVIYAVLATMLCSSLLFTAGKFYRVASILMWLCHTFFMNSGELSVYGVNRYLHLFSFLAIFLPLNSSFTLGKSKEVKQQEVELGLWTMRMALAITYFHAGIAKSRGVDWWTGDAVWRAINLPEFKQFDFFWLGAYPWIFQAAALATLLFESGYPFAIFSRQVRRLWIPIIISMHVGISLGLGLHFFAVAMIAFNIALFTYGDVSYMLSSRSHQKEALQ